MDCPDIDSNLRCPENGFSLLLNIFLRRKNKKAFQRLEILCLENHFLKMHYNWGSQIVVYSNNW